jgi:hypothetical protein
MVPLVRWLSTKIWDTAMTMSQLDGDGSREAERTKLPGFGLPIQEMPEYALLPKKYHDAPTLTYLRFPNAIADWCGSSGVTIYERRMLGLMGQITDKPNWHEKVFDHTIVARWWAEADALNETGVAGEELTGSGTGPEGDHDDESRRVKTKYLSRAMFDFCMAELRDKAGRFRETGMVAVLDTEATVVKSDSAVPAALRDRLLAAVAPLEDVPERLRDWHPGSNGLVLDLVHPSLWPLVYGKSCVMAYGRVPLHNMYGVSWESSEPTPAAAEATQTIKKRDNNGYGFADTVDAAAWDGFQWLPTEVKFRPEDGTAQIDSYINNLHPDRHVELYSVLEQMVDCAVPLWNEALSWFHDRIRIRDAGSGGNDDWETPEGASPPVWEKPEDWDDEDDMMDDDDYREEWEDWFRDVRILSAPDIGEFMPFDRTSTPAGAHPINLVDKFRSSGLQIIFKLANIHLTPDKPTYEGGTWHVEGALNEHICATALYYYDQQNVTDSELAFRQSIGIQELMGKPPQNEHDAVEMLYGVQNESSPPVQVLGAVKTSHQRMLVFPNVLHHRVSRFSLADKTQPGHRKILAMFLVDPHVRIISTANVPPQRLDWWADELRQLPWFARLPVELFDHIVSLVDDPWSLDEAKGWREQLMQARGRMNDNMNTGMDEASVSFCEH